jgi:DNA-binding response OmpR family regulator
MHALVPGPTVLVVDDDEALRMLCRVNLELDGYRVLEASTLGAARATLRTEPVSVVLLDVHVGEEDGRTLLRGLREDEAPLSVVLFTGSSEVDERHRELADGVLPKPFTLVELSSLVARLAGGLESPTS